MEGGERKQNTKQKGGTARALMKSWLWWSSGPAEQAKPSKLSTKAPKVSQLKGSNQGDQGRLRGHRATVERRG